MKLKLIFKGVLLWVTAFAVTLFMLGVDSIYDNGYFIHSVIICTILCLICYKVLSKEEFEILTLSKWIDKLLEKE